MKIINLILIPAFLFLANIECSLTSKLDAKKNEISNMKENVKSGKWNPTRTCCKSCKDNCHNN